MYIILQSVQSGVSTNKQVTLYDDVYHACDQMQCWSSSLVDKADIGKNTPFSTYQGPVYVQ